MHAPAHLTGGYGVKLNDDAPIYGKPGCDRFVARTVRGVDATTKPTPPWMSSRLRLAGIRSISLPVDISNYVMLELGQPLHFYDQDKLSGEIVVRRAVAGEKLKTLDGKDRALDAEDLLITDGSGPIGVAGVMGGAATEVSDATSTILIEAAHFEEVSIARSRRRHKLPSEASKRFERGVDWHVAHVAAQRAVDLLVELAGGTADEAGTDVGTAPDAVTVELPAAFAAERIGIDFTEDRSWPRCGTWAPSSRRPARLRGHGPELAHRPGNQGGPLRGDRPAGRLRQDPRHLAGSTAGPRPDPRPAAAPPARPGAGRRRPHRGAGLPVRLQGRQRHLRDSGAGTERKALKLANPISEEHGYLRTSILPGLIEVAKRNHSRGFRDLALFETGLVFLPGTRWAPPPSRRWAPSPPTRYWTACTTASRTSRCTSPRC